MSTTLGSVISGGTDLFAPLAGFMRTLCAPCPADRLNEMLTTLAEPPRSGGGLPIRFVATAPRARSYEQHVFDTGCVPTRDANWHDFFNALVWMRFPHTKAALNALHVHELAARASAQGRGELRDAATQFDESGVIVASADASLLDLLAWREWRALFVVRRKDVAARMRFLVFGHGLYDALRAPFYRICGRSVLIDVPQTLIDSDLERLCAHVDAIVAARFRERDWYPRPKVLMALPLLGIPGVTAENERPEYYDDRAQFRPLPID